LRRGRVVYIGAAAASVGAFPLPVSSKNACLLITLQPGISYAAQISGKSGATGVALVEVYEVPN
jgi:CHASE2 domain-containing sensor protein